MKTSLAALVWALGIIGCAAFAAEGEATAPANSELKTDDQKVAYTMGYLNGMNTLRYRFRADEWAAFLAGLDAAYQKKTPAADPDTWRPKIQPFAMARDAETAAENKKLGAEVLTKAAAEPGARKTSSGLIIKTTKPGTGASPTDSDQVKVKYRGTMADGTEFDNAEKHGGSVTFGVGGVIPCWTEALKSMKVGEIADIYCPSEIAYGDRGFAPKIPAGAVLHFTIELLEIVPRPAAAPAPTPTPTPKPNP